MSDSDGSPQRDNRHHRKSRSRSPVCPGCAGDPEALVPEQLPAGEAGPAAQAAALPTRPRQGPRMRKVLRPPPRAATPRPQAPHQGPPRPQRHAGRAQATASTPSQATTT